APALTSLARASAPWRAFAAVAAGVTALAIAFIVVRSDYAVWIVPLVILGAIACILAMFRTRVAAASAAFAAAAFFAAPLAWAATTLVAFDAGLPFAGPELLPRAGLALAGAPIGQPVPPRSALLDFLVAERRGERWIAATSSLGTAA